MGAHAMARCMRQPMQEHEVTVSYDRTAHAVTVELICDMEYPVPGTYAAPSGDFLQEEEAPLQEEEFPMVPTVSDSGVRWALSMPADTTSGCFVHMDSKRDRCKIALLQFVAPEYTPTADCAWEHVQGGARTCDWFSVRGIRDVVSTMFRMHANEARVLNTHGNSRPDLYNCTSLIATSKDVFEKFADFKICSSQGLGVFHVLAVVHGIGRVTRGTYVGCFLLDNLMALDQLKTACERSAIEDDCQYANVYEI